MPSGNQFYLNRRRFKRTKLRARAAVLRQGALKFQTAVEISEGGCLLRVDSPLKDGTPVEVRFFLPDGEYLKVVGEVVYHQQPTPTELFAGVKFTNPPEELCAAIRKFVKSAA